MKNVRFTEAGNYLYDPFDLYERYNVHVSSRTKRLNSQRKERNNKKSSNTILEQRKFPLSALEERIEKLRLVEMEFAVRRQHLESQVADILNDKMRVEKSIATKFVLLKVSIPRY